MASLEIFLISFFGSVFGTMVGFALTFWLYRKQKDYMDKMKKSIQRTVRRLRTEKK